MKNNIVWVFELTLKEGKLEELKRVMTELSDIAKGGRWNFELRMDAKSRW